MRAGQSGSPEGVIHITLQAMDAGPTEGNRERQQLCPSSFFLVTPQGIQNLRDQGSNLGPLQWKH